jgi:hypothetical protein
VSATLIRENRGRELPPYLVLLRVGFALPATLLARRCALTAPFHPYPGVATEAVCFLWHFPSKNLPLLRKLRARMGHSPPGRYPAHCSAEFGLSSPRARKRGKRPSGPAANLFIITLITSASGLGLSVSGQESLFGCFLLHSWSRADKLGAGSSPPERTQGE